MNRVFIDALFNNLIGNVNEKVLLMFIKYLLIADVN